MERKQLLALILESEHLDEDSVSPLAVLMLIGALIVLFVTIVQTGS